MFGIEIFSKLHHPFVLVMYVHATVSYLIHFLLRKKTTACLSTTFLALGIAGHFSVAISTAVRYGRHPMASIFEVLSMVALSMAVVYFIIELWRRNKSTGLFVMPLIVVLETVAFIGMKPVEKINPVLHNSYFGFHTGTVTLAYSAFFLSAVYGVMLLWFHRVLKKKKFGLIFERLPSLDILARMNRGATLIGFVFMTLAIGSGVAWAVSTSFGELFNARILSTFVVWIIFGISLVVHYALKWPNKRVALFTLAGFFCMVLSSALINAFVVDWHSFGANQP